MTYGTNNEFGFDYLRDNLAFRPEDRVQRTLSYAIVDEVDSILVDEARTPLIISGRAEESTELYTRINQLIPSLKVHKPPSGKANDEIESSQVELLSVNGKSLGKMSTGQALAKAKEDGHHLIEIDTEASPAKAQLFVPGDYTIDEKTKQAHLTEEGHEYVEKLLLKAGLIGEGESLYDPGNIRLMHHLTAALARARVVQARSGLHRPRRRGHHRRRVHRPHDGRPALVGRPAPGRRGEGRRARTGGEPDGRVDHLPELLPHVQEARRA